MKFSVHERSRNNLLGDHLFTRHEFWVNKSSRWITSKRIGQQCETAVKLCAVAELGVFK